MGTVANSSNMTVKLTCANSSYRKKAREARLLEKMVSELRSANLALEEDVNRLSLERNVALANPRLHRRVMAKRKGKK